MLMVHYLQRVERGEVIFQGLERVTNKRGFFDFRPESSKCIASSILVLVAISSQPLRLQNHEIGIFNLGINIVQSVFVSYSLIDTHQLTSVLSACFEKKIILRSILCIRWIEETFEVILIIFKKFKKFFLAPLQCSKGGL